MTGIVGIFWKKIYRYTVIEYNDGIQDQTVILDFHKEANKAQKIIYNQMAGARLKQKGLTELEAENEQNALTEQKALTEHYKVLEDTNNNKEKEKELEMQETEKLKTEEQQSQEQKEFEEFKKWKESQKNDVQK